MPLRSLILALVLSAGLAPAFAQAPPPVPALPDTERRTSYVISASTCACAVGFQLYQDSTDVANWVKVYINGVEIPQSGNWNITSPSGSISTLPRPITNAVLTFTSPRTGTVQIVGAQRPRRLSEYAENRGVSARDLNQAINGIEAQLREMWDRQFRTVQAPPGETLNTLPPQSGRANMGACFDSSGNLAPCLGAVAGTFVAGNGINFTGTGPTTISTATYAAGNGIQFFGSNPTTIAVSASSGTPFLPSRAIAATLDLSAYSAIQTGGYSTPGDGGGAIFRKLSSGSFIDSYITAKTIAGGSGYANGTFYGVIYGSAGNATLAVGVVTVVGGAVTAVDITYTPGNYCTVGAVWVTGSLAGGSGHSFTVTTCAPPRASFTDSVGNKFQFVPQGWPNVLQFGAKGDWDGNDASATDNFAAIQAASWFAANKSSTHFDSGGYWGGKVIFPSGSYMACGNTTTSLVVAQSVTFEGPSEVGATLKMCDTFNPSMDFIELCDPNWRFACVGGARIKYMSLFAKRTVSNSNGVYMVHSNSLQDFGGLDHVYIYPGQRGCMHLEKGYGGASTVSVSNVSCNGASPNTVMMLFGNTVASGLAFGTTVFQITNLVLGGPSSCLPTCQSQPGLVLRGGGFYDIAGVHCENAGQNCITVDIPAGGNTDMVRLHNINAGWGAPAIACTGTIFLAPTNNPGNTIIGMVPPGSCANVVLNGQPAGSNRTTPIVLDIVFNP